MRERSDLVGSPLLNGFFAAVRPCLAGCGQAFGIVVDLEGSLQFALRSLYMPLSQ